MNRWNGQNRLTKRDAIELKRELADVKEKLGFIEKLILQENSRIIQNVKNDFAQGQRAILNDSESIMEKLFEIVQVCQNNNNKCDDVGELIKILLMDSLVKEVEKNNL